MTDLMHQPTDQTDHAISDRPTGRDGQPTDQHAPAGDQPDRNPWTPAVWGLSITAGVAALTAVYGLHTSRHPVVGWAARRRPDPDRPRAG